MTKREFEALRDCASKIKGIAPSEEKIRELFSFLSVVDRIAEIYKLEGASGIELEAPSLPENTSYERAFKESLCMWINGAGYDKATDHAADRYFEENPSGFDAAIFFAAIFSASGIFKEELAFGFIDLGLQHLFPDGWRWFEEDEKEKNAHKDEEGWYSFEHSHRDQFIGKAREGIEHRFDDIKVCSLIPLEDPDIKTAGKRVSEKIAGYGNGALQLIMKQLTYPELERALYALTEKAEDRVISNLSSHFIPIIKGQCILNKDTVGESEIREALAGFEQAIDNYSGDPLLEAEYEDW